MNLHSGLISTWVLAMLAATALAESSTLTVPRGTDIELMPLLDQSFEEGGMVTVQPRFPDDTPLPEHCLLSINVSLDGDATQLTPGKMICISEERTPVEGVPDAERIDFGTCQVEGAEGCELFVVNTGDVGQMTLRTDLVLEPQPRSERN